MAKTNYGNLDKEDAATLAFTQQSYMPESERTNLGAFEYDAELSNADTAVWHDPVNKQTHVANRGSKTAYDWFISDFQILTGTEAYGSRFQRAVNQTVAAHNKHGYDVTTSGHSLGGAASSYTTETLGGEDWYKGGTGFNPGSSPFGRDGLLSKQRSDCGKADPPAYCGKQSNVKINGDPISMLTTGYGTTKNYGTEESMAFKAAKFMSPGFAVGSGLLNHTMGNFNSRVDEAPKAPAADEEEEGTFIKGMTREQSDNLTRMQNVGGSFSRTAAPVPLKMYAVPLSDENTGEVQMAEVASDSEDEDEGEGDQYAESFASFYKPAELPEETYNAAPPSSNPFAGRPFQTMAQPEPVVYQMRQPEPYEEEEEDDAYDEYDAYDAYDEQPMADEPFSWLNGVSAESQIIGHVPYNAKDESQYAYKLIYYK